MATKKAAAGNTQTEHQLAISQGLARSTDVLRVRSLYKAKRKEPGRAPEGYVDDDLNAECWQTVRGEGL